ncbi:MAG: dihydrolipoamide acetyltransferase family protein [Ornithinimicrobium sp.]
MATVLRMPGVSADASEAALLEWAVSQGDAVKRGDVVATVETEKAVVDLEAEDDGVLLKTFASAGESVAIGGPIAVFLEEGEQAEDEEAILEALGLGPQDSGPLQSAEEERSQDTLMPDAEPEIEHTADTVVNDDRQHRGDNPEHSDKGGRRIFATPLVRRLAAEAGVPLEDLKGSGPNGRIRRGDLDAALAARSEKAVEAAPQPESSEPAPTRASEGHGQALSGDGFTEIPHSTVRRAVAKALTSSKQNVPHFYLKATCRVDTLLELRAKVNAEGGSKVTINDFFVKAAALALAEMPEMNVVWTPDAVRQFDAVDVAVAMATERGLMTPVVRSVPARALSDISATIKDLAQRAGAGTLKQKELEGGSLTISNLGMFGVEEFVAIINPPQVGILAVGAVTPQAVEGATGELHLARCVKVVLSVDHRSVDGALAAQWLHRVKELVENPFRILI